MSIWMLFCLVFMKPRPYWEGRIGSISGKIVFISGGVVLFDQYEWGDYRILFASEDMRAGKVGARPLTTLPGKWTELSTGSYAMLEWYSMGRFHICTGVLMCTKNSMPREKPPPKPARKPRK